MDKKEKHTSNETREWSLGEASTELSAQALEKLIQRAPPLVCSLEKWVVLPRETRIEVNLQDDHRKEGGTEEDGK